MDCRGSHQRDVFLWLQRLVAPRHEVLYPRTALASQLFPSPRAPTSLIPYTTLTGDSFLQKPDAANTFLTSSFFLVTTTLSRQHCGISWIAGANLYPRSPSTSGIKHK